MPNTSNRPRVAAAGHAFFLLATVGASVLVTYGRAQEADRQLWDTEFLKKRPVAETPADLPPSRIAAGPEERRHVP